MCLSLKAEEVPLIIFEVLQDICSMQDGKEEDSVVSYLLAKDLIRKYLGK